MRNKLELQTVSGTGSLTYSFPTISGADTIVRRLSIQGAGTVTWTVINESYPATYTVTANDLPIYLDTRETIAVTVVSGSGAVYAANIREMLS